MSPMRLFTATTTVQQVAPSNAKRRTLAIYNLGTDTVFISQDQVGVTTGGFPVLVNTGVVLLRFHGDEPELVLYVVANSGSQALRIFEGFGDPEAPTGTEPGGRGPLA